MDRLARKFETLRLHVPQPVVDVRPNAQAGFVAFGTSHYAVEESRDQLRSEYGIETDYLRLKAYPFTKELREFIGRHERFYVVEQNRDAQLLSLMRMEFEPEEIAKLRSVRYYGGLPIDARTVTDNVLNQEKTRQEGK
jgi:2-oxoglutarate ferredoxin oxidoreductase subunit alpha